MQYDGWTKFFSLMKQHGFSPRRVADVGANRGNWTRQAWSHFPDAEFLLIEPLDELRTHVTDLVAAGAKIRWITAGAGDRAGVLPFTVTYRDDSNSFIPTAEVAAAHGFRQVDVPVRTLNDIVVETGGVVPEMVKIDAEGFDLKVIEGASNLLGKTDIFFLEAAVCAPGIPNTMAAVIAKMEGADYRLIDITDINRSPKHGVLWLCELAFMRRGCGLLDKVRKYE